MEHSPQSGVAASNRRLQDSARAFVCRPGQIQVSKCRESDLQVFLSHTDRRIGLPMKHDGRARMVNQYIVFVLDGQRYALNLSAVARVVHMVHITPLSNALDVLLGVVNMEGRVMPVINVRHRFNLPKRKIHLSDLLIFTRTKRRSVALVADAVTDIIECPERSLISAELILPGLEQVEGIIKLEDGLVVVQNLDKFLSLEEEKFLDSALAAI